MGLDLDDNRTISRIDSTIQEQACAHSNKHTHNKTHIKIYEYEYEYELE